MIQHRSSFKKIFIYNAHKSKKKKVVAKPHFVLNLKKRCFCFSKQINDESNCLKKTKAELVKTTPFLLNVLIIDFTVLITQIIQKIIKKRCVLCENTIKKSRDFSKNTSVFIKDHFYVFLPQHNLKEPQS
tara:strand:- start:154 stop:543 length:390 start_codon:yes stop_codon:yes gene_type:complete